MHVLDAATTATDVVSGCRLVKSPHYDHSLSLSLYLSLSTGFTNRYRVAQFTGRVQRFQPVRGSYEPGFQANHGDPSRRGHTSPPRGWLLSWQKPPAEYCGISWKCIGPPPNSRDGTRALCPADRAFQMPGVKAILR